MAKCRITRTDANIDLDYEFFASFNQSRQMQLGIMRLIIRKDQSFEVYWKDPEKNFARAIAKVIFEPGRSLAEFDVEKIRNSKSNPTEILQLINARRGQGNFRAKLQMRWNGQCALTGITNDTILRASHIKPWAECKGKERLDPNNGLLLAAHVDALFDQYLITFGKEGELIWSSIVSDSDREALALPEKLSVELKAEEKRYLMHHNQAFCE